MIGLGVAQTGAWMGSLEVVKDMAPGDVDVEVAVEIVVEEAGAEAQRIEELLDQLKKGE